MPELPELEVIGEALRRRVVGQVITRVEVLPPGGGIVLRDLTGEGAEALLTGATVGEVVRRGKFLLLSLAHESQPGPLYAAVNFKLTGRFQLAEPKDKRLAKTHLVWTLASSQELRYVDAKTMGQVYLTHDLARVPEWNEQGPEPFDLGLEEFRTRLRPFREEIKGILTRGECVAGIGNAYADEILWAARLHPFRKRTQLAPAEQERLFTAIQETLRTAIEQVRLAMQERIHTEPREFMSVHMKTGGPCPRCGTPISVVQANQRVTNFCRKCQPGGLIRGM